MRCCTGSCWGSRIVCSLGRMRWLIVGRQWRRTPWRRSGLVLNAGARRRWLGIVVTDVVKTLWWCRPRNRSIVDGWRRAATSGRTRGATPWRVDDWNRCGCERQVGFSFGFSSVDVVVGAIALTYQPASPAATLSRPPLYTEPVDQLADGRVELWCTRSKGPKVDGQMDNAHHQMSRLVNEIIQNGTRDE